MQAIYEQATGDTHALFREATERFAEVLAGMKQMAAEMQRELEATRNELRRGILELPQETAESAAQMRRVIVDQIEALAELNRIVARHGRNLDAVEPLRRAPRSRRWRSSAAARETLRRHAAASPHRPAPRRRARDVSSFAPAAPRRAEPPPRSARRRKRPPAAAGCPICSPAPRARKASRPRELPREPVRDAPGRSAQPTSARRGTRSSRSIRSRSTSPA